MIHLGEYPDALLKQVRVVLHPDLAQQLLKSYPPFIGRRRASPSRLIGLFRDRNHTVAVFVNAFALTRSRGYCWFIRRASRNGPRITVYSGSGYH
jgi:hypothetical protein